MIAVELLLLSIVGVTRVLVILCKVVLKVVKIEVQVVNHIFDKCEMVAVKVLLCGCSLGEELD